MKRARAIGLCLSVVGLASTAPAASAQVVVDASTHKHFGVAPRPGAQRFAHALSAGSSTPLLYGGGPVQHAEHDYLFFWDPAGALPAAYKTGLSQWLTDLAGPGGAGTPVGIAQQYYDNSGPGGAQSPVSFAVQNAGSLTDTTAYPATGGCAVTSGYSNCLTDAQIEAELSSYIAANHLPTGIGVEYFVFTPQGVNTCFDSTSNQCASNVYCGYHSIYQLPRSVDSVVYADMPWTYQVTGCDSGPPHLNSTYIDSAANVFSHELTESMTDPDTQRGWIDSSGNEIADKCEGSFGQTQAAPGNGAPYNVKLGSDYYLLQGEFSNRTLGCELTQSIPVNSSPPLLAGNAQQGSSLSESNGTWSNSPTSFGYQWQRCDAAGASCTPISGATTQTYLLRPEDVGHTIRVAETASNATGSGLAVASGPSAPVAALPPPPATPTVAPVAWTPPQSLPPASQPVLGPLPSVQPRPLIRRLLTQHRLRYALGAPGPGQLTLTVRLRGIVIARGTRGFTSAGHAAVMVKLTTQGRRALRRPSLARALKLQLVLTFNPASGAPTTLRRSFTVRTGR